MIIYLLLLRIYKAHFKSMLLDVLVKICQFGVYRFFLTCSAAEFTGKRCYEQV